MTGSEINQARLKKGLTLAKLAKLAKISVPFLWDVEHDKRKPSQTKLLQISAALEIPMIICPHCHGKGVIIKRKKRDKT